MNTDRFNPVTRDDLDTVEALGRRMDRSFTELREAIADLTALVRSAVQNHENHTDDDRDEFAAVKARLDALERQATPQ